MSSELQREKALELSKKAIVLDKEQKYHEALGYYKQSIKSFLQILKSIFYLGEENSKVQETFRNKLNEYLARAEEIFEFLNEKNKNLNESDENEVDDGGDDYRGLKEERVEDNYKGLVLNEKNCVKWDEIFGLGNAKKFLQETVILLQKFQEFFGPDLKPWKTILMYGVSGTGKSLLAKACATEANANFFSVCLRDLILNHLEESERIIRSLFEKARANTPSVIYIKKIDSLTDNNPESDLIRRLKTEFLLQMDLLTTNTDSILIISSTSLPWSIAPAIRRRFSRRVYIPLPDYSSRTQIIAQYTSPSTLTPLQTSKLSKLTDSFSIPQILQLIKSTYSLPTKRSETGTFFMKIQEDNKEKFKACKENDPGSIKMNFSEVPIGCLLYDPVNFNDFCEVIKFYRPTATVNEMFKFREFTENFGFDG